MVEFNTPIWKFMIQQCKIVLGAFNFSHILIQTRKQTFHQKHSQVLSDSLFQRQITFLLKRLTLLYS